MLTESIDAYVERRQSIREPDGLWHASSMFSCDRQAVYVRIGAEKTNPRSARSSRTLYLGSLLHALVQDALREYVEIDAALGTQVYTEVKLDVPEWEFRSSADGLVILPKGRAFLIEYKTTSEYGFKKSLPQQAHTGQVCAYGWALRKYGSQESLIAPLGDNLDRACIVYINKSNLDTRLCWLDLNADTDAAIEKKMTDLSLFVKHDLLPDRLAGTYEKRDWLCGYCEYATRCWDTDE